MTFSAPKCHRIVYVGLGVILIFFSNTGMYLTMLFFQNVNDVIKLGFIKLKNLFGFYKKVFCRPVSILSILGDKNKFQKNLKNNWFITSPAKVIKIIANQKKQGLYI